MAEYLIQDTTLTGIASAVRNLRHEIGLFTPAQIEAKIRSSLLGLPISVNPGEWVRPQDYPDIDALADAITGDQDCLYLTYDLRKTAGYGWIGLYGKTSDSSSWTVDRGHVENGAFVSDETFTINSNEHIRQTLNSANGNVQLFRITSTGHITETGFVTNSATTAESLNNNLQPCVQRAGTLPWCKKWFEIPMNEAPGSRCGGTVWLERDALIPGKNAVVTTTAYMFSGCCSLKSLDLSGWDTSNWAVTSMASMFSSCYNLQSLDLSGWNTSNWAVTSMAGMLNGCYSLRSINMSGWDTSGWAVTNMSYLFANCHNLRTLDLNGWDTSNWAVTDMSKMFSECYGLEFLNAKDWDTSSWAVTNMSEMFSRCNSLQSLDIDDWDTGSWAVTNLSSMFNYCYSLQSLNLEDWDTSSWAVTDMSNMFYYCHSLQTLEVGDWDTSSWVVATMANMFNTCVSLQSLDIGDWDTSSWAVTNIGGMFSQCRSLRSIDISGWITSNWAVTLYGSIFTGCTSLETVATPASMGIPNTQTSSSSGSTPNIENVVNCTGYALYGNHYYSTAKKLSRASLLSIIDRLPTVSGKTITLGQSNKLKLTAAEIAVATGKGWTVA